MYHVASIIALLFNVYQTLLVARIILTWVPHNKYHFIISAIYDVTDPYLDIFRSLKLNFGGIDISPIVAFMVLGFVQKLVMQLFFL